jgi:hypothetical protein
MPTNQKNPAIADPDTRDSGVVHSDATLKGGSRMASADELALALEASQREIAELKAAAAARESQGSDLKQLADLLAGMVAPKNTVTAVPEQDAINRSTDFKNQRATVDGRSLVEAQQTMALFRNEDKMPMSIPKTMANIIGPNLDVTVNGVRVSIPCDGKTHYINRTHYEHARERLAKLDKLAANTEPQVVEIS